MYRYDDLDRTLILERVEQFKDQTERYLSGELSEEEFLPLRLQNGLYIQRHAPMLRIAIPYGLVSSHQLRKLAEISRKYDKGYAHFTTRQNLQLNWPELQQVPSILEALATVEMHAVQTSGNCVRNVTSDPFAGVAPDEYQDPRPYCELVRQWSSFHPEFAFLPRKFKIAVCGSDQDRAAIQVHDIGLGLKLDPEQGTGFTVWVGGGLGRTPIIGQQVADFVPESDILIYLEAILRVYNLTGRRDNKYKARIKILVKALGVEAFAQKVDAVYQSLKQDRHQVTPEEIQRLKGFFTEPDYLTFNTDTLQSAQAAIDSKAQSDPYFAKWLSQNTHPHKVEGYRAISLSLKRIGTPPGDISDEHLDSVADLADQFSFGEARATHEQNIVLADVALKDLIECYELAKTLDLASPNIGLMTDMICCPGGDFCSLANAKSIPVAEAIMRTFDDLDYQHDIGELDINISGCMNACGHHHIGHIGVLGVDKKGKEFFQISLGGQQGNLASLGKIIGPSFSDHEIPSVIGKLLKVYLEQRMPEERFLDTYERIGLAPFKEHVYAKNN